MRVAGGLRGGKKGGLLMRVSGAGEEEGALDDGLRRGEGQLWLPS